MTFWSRGAVTGLILALLAPAPARPADSAARVVLYADDALTVRLSRASMNEVLDEIARQTGAEIRGHAADSREISADFDAVPLPEALDRLLGAQNFTLVYGESGKLKAVRLLGEMQKPGPRPPATPLTPDMYPHDVMAVFLDRSVPLAPGGRLRLLLAASTATVRRVLDVGLRNPDAAVRAEAVHAVMQVAEADPQLQTALSESISGMDDNTLSGVLRQAAGEHTEEVVSIVASDTKIGPLRAKAKVLLRTMRAGG
jgi:hypothetical protein